MKKTNKVFAIFALVLLVTAIGCTKAEGQSGGGASRSSGKESPASDFSYGLTDDGRGVKITGYTGKGGAVVIPSKIEGMPVLEIGENAFQGEQNKNRNPPNNRDAITSIVVPNSVEVLGTGFNGLSANFDNMAELTSVTLPDGLKVIPNNAFSYCKKLRRINLPASLEEIHAFAFSNCGELTDLVIPDSIQTVRFLFNGEVDPGNFAFQGCQKLPLAIRSKIQGWGYTSGF